MTVKVRCPNHENPAKVTETGRVYLHAAGLPDELKPANGKRYLIVARWRCTADARHIGEELVGSVDKPPTHT